MNFKKDMISGILISALVCFALSFLVGGFAMPFPRDEIANAVRNGMSGFFSGAISAGVTTMLLYKKMKESKQIQ